MRLALVLAALTLGGCQLYFGGDDEPPPTCGYGGEPGWGTDDGYPSNLLRNPQTGDCEEFGYGGGGGWGGNCYYDEYYDQCVCDDVAQPTSPPVPNWPACESSCSILDEETCLDEPGCQVAYFEQPSPTAPLFRGCYATMGGPDIYTSCFNLDAYGCAQHDNCSIFYTAVYDHPPPLGGGGMTPPSDSYAQFTQCRPEPTSAGCSAVDCGPGYRCEDSCYPTPGGGSQCTPMCVPEDQSCAAIDCAPGYECVDTCDSVEPSMNGGTFPGYCTGSCVPLAACETLTTQNACEARGDCTSVFEGDDCTCYPGGYCECAILTWDHCETVGAVPMPL